MVLVLMIERSWPTTKKLVKEMDDMKKQPIKKGISFNWDTPEGMDK